MYASSASTPPYQPPSLLDPEFEYVNHAKTNVQDTWRRFGWEPPCPLTQAEMRLKLNRLI